MPRVSAAFFLVATLCIVFGMLWGMHMGMRQDFTLAPAHAHLNLVGWVTMALYGTFYALTRESMSARLAWTNFIVSTVGIVVMIPSLALMLATSDLAKYSAPVAVGSVIVFLGLLIFLVSVVRELFRKRA
jgi:cbb3-type cytochrome oxidase subunit 1